MSIKHKLINTGNYLLIVDESEIKEGDWFLNNYSSSYYIDKKASESSQRFALNSNNVFINPKKIIAHLPLNNSPILEGVDLLPPLEDDVEKLADALGFYDSTEDNKGNRTTKAFITGYNKAKENYKYTEEDMIQAAKYGYEFRDTTSFPEHKFEDSCINNTKQWLQSLQQPKIAVGFKCEMEDVKMLKNRTGGVTYFGKPKTTTNSQGLTQWVGEYIY